MTRDSKTISAVFMAVVLVIASGAAVSLAVTATDGGTNAVEVQNTTTTTTEDPINATTTEDDGADEDGVTEGDETDEEDGDVGQDDEATQEQVSITFDEQESDGEHLVIESVTMPEDGFVAIHSEDWEEAPLATVLGSSVYLEEGDHENVNISLARPLNGSQTVVAMLHSDTNDNQVYDFVLSSGDLDGPITENGSVVVDDAEVTVEQETTTTTEEDDGVDTVTTTEEDDGVDTVTTTEEDDGLGETETTTEEDDGLDETTTTTEEDDVEDGMEQFVFKVEQMNVDRWSFVVGDEETPDETVYVNGSELLPPDGSLSDERVTVNLSELQQQGAISEEDMQFTTTQSPEEIEEQVEENLTEDIQTVQYVIQNVNVENVTLVVLAPSDVDFPAQPPAMEETTTEDEEEETTTETTTTETPITETPTETTITETPTETTTTEEEPVTTTEEEPVTTTEEETPTTTEENETEDAESFQVSGLTAPDSATIGETIEVSATISNEGDTSSTQTVAFRLEGDVRDSQEVTLDAGEQTNVTFGVDTSGLEPAEYTHGVYTVEFGDLDVIVLEDAADDEADDGETDDADEGEGDAADGEADEPDTVTTDTTTETDDGDDVGNGDDAGNGDDTGDDTDDADDDTDDDTDTATVTTTTEA